MRTLRQLSVFGLAAAISFGAAAAPKKRAPKEKPAVTESMKSERATKADPKPKHPTAKRPVDKAASAKKQAEKPSVRRDKQAAAADKKRAEPARPAPARGAKTSPRLRAEPEAPAPAARGSMRPGNRYLDIPAREIAEGKKAFIYANLSDEQALAELTRRNIPFVTARAPMPGVRTPIRLTGPLHGVTIRSTLPPAQRRTTFFEILDARLAIALDDFCALLARHDVVELVHFTMYRPPGELPPNFGEPLTRHPGGLAIDLGALRKRDGNLLAVGPHWPSNIGAKTCGDGAEQLWERPGRELLSIVCEASDEGLFHYILTPRFDSAHGDHLHLEIKPETRWFLVN
jgi:hypothetical protein